MEHQAAQKLGSGIKGFLFDMDGTLTVPVLDFALMRQRVGVPHGLDVLTEVEKMDDEERVRCMKSIEEMEDEGIEKLQLQPGLLDLFQWIREHSHGPYKTAIVTRNAGKAVEHFLAHSGLNFDIVLDRAFRPYKPAPEPILHICKEWDFHLDEVLFIGDSKDDLGSASAAGCASVLIKNPKNQYLIPEATYHADTLSELIPLFESLVAKPLNSQ